MTPETHPQASPALPPLPERDNDELRCAVWDSLCYWRDSGSGFDALQASNEAEDMLDKLLQSYAGAAIALDRAQRPQAGVEAVREAAQAVGMPSLLTPDEIDFIAADGMRNAAGGIYATMVYKFANGIEDMVRERQAKLWHRVMARLADMLDDDKFNEIEGMLRDGGFAAPSSAPAASPDVAKLMAEAKHEAREAAECVYEENAFAHLCRMDAAIDALGAAATQASAAEQEVGQ